MARRRKNLPFGIARCISTRCCRRDRPESVAKAFASARGRFGEIAILVNNAGQAASAPFLKTDPALWRKMMAVNLDGTFHCTQAALAGMLAAGWGRIINVASTAGLTGYGYVTAYCAAKHGVVGLTRALAVEVATKGVTVNAVCPGFTDTDIVRERSRISLRRRGALQSKRKRSWHREIRRKDWCGLRKLQIRWHGSACQEAKRSRDRRLLWLAAN